MSKNKKRYGRVLMKLSYVVDLDNQAMINEAKDCLYEDFMSIHKYNELAEWIEVKEDKTAKESDIPEFLRKTNNE
jgi:hypothetical protein